MTNQISLPEFFSWVDPELVIKAMGYTHIKTKDDFHERLNVNYYILKMYLLFVNWYL